MRLSRSMRCTNTTVLAPLGPRGSKGYEIRSDFWGTTALPQTFTESGDGVLGEGQNGVHGRSRSPTDSGVWGENTNGGFGVTGSTNAGTGQRGTIAGVWGSNPGAGAGVRGTGGKTGVLGEGDGSSGSIGVEGKSANEGVGVHGEGAVGVHGIFNFSGGLGFNAGVHAEHTANGFGLLANTNGGVGVAAVGHNKTGVLGEGDGEVLEASAWRANRLMRVSVYMGQAVQLEFSARVRLECMENPTSAEVSG